MMIYLFTTLLLERRIVVCALTIASRSRSARDNRAANPLLDYYSTRIISKNNPSFCFGQRQTQFAATTRLFASKTTNKFSEELLRECKREFQQAIDLHNINLKATPTNVKNLLQDLETEASEPSFWDAENKDRNAYVTSQTSIYSRLVSRLDQWQSWKDDGEVALDMLTSEDASAFTNDEKNSLFEELQSVSKQLLEGGERYQLELLLSGPYDDQPCRILLTAGAGGTEANDW